MRLYMDESIPGILFDLFTAIRFQNKAENKMAETTVNDKHAHCDAVIASLERERDFWRERALHLEVELVQLAKRAAGYTPTPVDPTTVIGPAKTQ